MFGAMPDGQRQRCVKHKLSSVLAHVPENHHDVVGKEFMATFYQKNCEKADEQAVAVRQSYRAVYAGAIAIMDCDREA